MNSGQPNNSTVVPVPIETNQDTFMLAEVSCCYRLNRPLDATLQIMKISGT